MAKQRRSSGPQSGRQRGKRGGSLPENTGPPQLRIVGGEFRTRRLKYSGDQRVRPMKDRTREAVFNLIGPTIRGTHVWDLFAGTGAMALESLSRGASSATMVERHLGTGRIIQENIDTLKVNQRAEVIQANVFFWARAFANPAHLPTVPSPDGRTDSRDRTASAIAADVNPSQRPPERIPAANIPWTVFCCPPYAFYQERFDDLCTLLRNLRAVAPLHSIFVVEAEMPFDFQQLWDEPWKTRNYTPAAIGVHYVE